MLPHLKQQMAALGKASRKGRPPLTKYRSSSCTACLHISRVQSTVAFQPWVFHCRAIQSCPWQQLVAEINFRDIANHRTLGRGQQCHLQQSCPLSPLRCQNLLLAVGSTLCCFFLTSTKKTDDDKAKLQVGKEPKNMSQCSPIFASPAFIMKMFWDFMSPQDHKYQQECNGRQNENHRCKKPANVMQLLQHFCQETVEYVLRMDVLQCQQALAEYGHRMRFSEWLLVIFVLSDQRSQISPIRILHHNVQTIAFHKCVLSL